jgi:hypothetical protein
MIIEDGFLEPATTRNNEFGENYLTCWSILLYVVFYEKKIEEVGV